MATRALPSAPAAPLARYLSLSPQARSRRRATAHRIGIQLGDELLLRGETLTIREVGFVTSDWVVLHVSPPVQNAHAEGEQADLAEGAAQGGLRSEQLVSIVCGIVAAAAVLVSIGGCVYCIKVLMQRPR